MPFGIAKTDTLIIKLADSSTAGSMASRTKGQSGRRDDDAHQYMHGKKFAYTAIRLLFGYISFLLEMGAEPHHIVLQQGEQEGGRRIFRRSSIPLLTERTVKFTSIKDLWHLRSLVMTDPVDAMIGDTHGKFITRDAKIPLFRFGFPIFDRVNKHRYPSSATGGINMVSRSATSSSISWTRRVMTGISR